VIRIGLTLLLSIAIGLVVWTWLALDRPVAKVRVVGDLNAAERQQVRETLRYSVNDTLLSMDLQEVAADLEALSWPRQVKVRRVWPDSLTVELEKALVVAAWNDDYLTMDGRVVQLAMEIEELVRFQCHHTAPRAALDLYQRLQRDSSAVDLQIAELIENDLGEWTLKFTNGIDLNLGVSELSARLQRFVSVYERELGSQVAQIAAVDARYASGVAVRWLNSGNTDLSGSAGQPLSMSVAGNHTRAKNGFR